MRLFEGVFLPWRRRRLAAVHIAGVPRGIGSLPVIMVANHTSWWDGFLLRDVHRRLGAGRPLYTVMLERELARRPFLRRLGAVGIEPGRASSTLALLRGFEEVRTEAGAPWVSFFPQGRIRPSWVRPLGFRPGIESVLERIGDVVVLPVGLHLEPLNRPAPTAFVSMGPPLGPGSDPSVAALERAVELEVDGILAFVGVHGEASSALWPTYTEWLPAPNGAGARVARGGTA